MKLGVGGLLYEVVEGTLHYTAQVVEVVEGSTNIC